MIYLIGSLGKYLHILDVERLAECEDAIMEDTQTFGIGCTKKLLVVKEINVSYHTDVYRLKRDSRLLASNSGNSESTENADILVLVNASVLTMESGRMPRDFVQNARVVVKGGVVERVGAEAEVELPKGAKIVDLDGGRSYFSLINLLEDF